MRVLSALIGFDLRNCKIDCRSAHKKWIRLAAKQAPMSISAERIHNFITRYVSQCSSTDRDGGGMTGEMRVGSDFLIGLIVDVDRKTVQLDIIKAYHLRELRPVHKKLLDSLGFHRNGPGLQFSFDDAQTVHVYAEITSKFCDALLNLEDGLDKLKTAENSK